jgi:nucleotide-binding universal stress UspA family protein
MWRIKMTDEIDMIIEDDSDSWQAQLQLEERQRSEEERPNLRELTERLGQAITILNVLDPEIQRLREPLLTLKADIEKESEKLSAGMVEAARRAGL